MVRVFYLTLASVSLYVAIAQGGDCIESYWEVPADFVTKMHMRIAVPEVDQTLIYEGNLDPTKHYEIVEMFKPIGDHRVGEIFTGISADVTGKGVVRLFSSKYPMRNKDFQASAVSTTDEGTKIVLLILERRWIQEYKRFTRQDTLTDLQAKKVAKIEKAFIGFTPDSVFAKHPECAGFTDTGQQDENGDPIYIPKFTQKRWSCTGQQ